MASSEASNNHPDEGEPSPAQSESEDLDDIIEEASKTIVTGRAVRAEPLRYTPADISNRPQSRGEPVLARNDARTLMMSSGLGESSLLVRMSSYLATQLISFWYDAEEEEVPVRRRSEIVKEAIDSAMISRTARGLTAGDPDDQDYVKAVIKRVGLLVSFYKDLTKRGQEKERYVPTPENYGETIRTRLNQTVVSPEIPEQPQGRSSSVATQSAGPAQPPPLSVSQLMTGGLKPEQHEEHKSQARVPAPQNGSAYGTPTWKPQTSAPVPKSIVAPAPKPAIQSGWLTGHHRPEPHKKVRERGLTDAASTVSGGSLPVSSKKTFQKDWKLLE
ncbi:hypothetical protein NLJ89_g4984 [Agrocybe chaxingu]|uniref:Uncharacterized protein n=1 Tax=Agrocybe chaxingu TaxID=84603 RepID=A0A9W8K121_9AGAR|nr:hypothetical protein NLJ89_g4984 [Agrocybe chaxingu]